MDIYICYRYICNTVSLLKIMTFGLFIYIYANKRNIYIYLHIIEVLFFSIICFFNQIFFSNFVSAPKYNNTIRVSPLGSDSTHPCSSVLVARCTTPTTAGSRHLATSVSNISSYYTVCVHHVTI